MIIPQSVPAPLVKGGVGLLIAFTYVRAQAFSAYGSSPWGVSRGNGTVDCICDVVYATERHDAVYSTEPDHYLFYVAGRRHSSLSGNRVALLTLRSAHATEQVDQDCRTMATAKSADD